MTAEDHEKLAQSGAGEMFYLIFGYVGNYHGPDDLEGVGVVVGGQET